MCTKQIYTLYCIMVVCIVVFLQVMHEFPVVYGWSGETTSRSDYIHHNVVALEQGRLEAMRTNKVRGLPALWGGRGAACCSRVHISC